MLDKITGILGAHDTVAILPHVNPDGDCLGSALALCSALRALGKEAAVVTNDPLPKNLTFLWDDSFCPPDGWEATLAVAVDCADPNRMSERAVFDRAAQTVCIDHHGTNPGYGEVAFVDASAAATGEIIYTLLTAHMGITLSSFERDCLYAAITLDTGNFKFSNTTARTHEIAASLVAQGVDVAEMSRVLFDTMTAAQLKAHAEAVKNLTIHLDGRVAATYVSPAFLAQNGMGFEEVDFLSAMPRTIDGVEVGIFCKEKTPGETKVSLRSNRYVDVSAVAAAFGGGGHIRAAGATLQGTPDEAISQLLKEIEKQM